MAIQRKKGVAKAGKFIVIDGIDGSGKSTQFDLLIKRLKKNKIAVKTPSFPQYEKNLFGKLIGECLRGERGDFATLDPKIASTLYAADRFETKELIEGWLKEGYTVIADRYASANQLHQGGKIKNKREREGFLKWLDIMEYKVFGIPRPDAIIFLYVPVEVSQVLMRERELKEKRSYLKGKVDVHEKDVLHQQAALESALSIIKKKNAWHKVDCVVRNKMRTREEIHEDVFNTVKKVLNRKLLK
ncbi:MAG: thymidylate kinase [Parcubacteria group bacterium]|nr:thymidylate kinase [Parcubacteria group bacterium]